MIFLSRMRLNLIAEKYLKNFFVQATNATCSESVFFFCFLFFSFTFMNLLRILEICESIKHTTTVCPKFVVLENSLWFERCRA